MWIYTSIKENQIKSIILLIMMPISLFVIFLLGIFLIYVFDNWFFEFQTQIYNWTISNFFYDSLNLTQELFYYIWPAILLYIIISFIFYKKFIFNFTWAKALERKDNPEIYNIIENLCISQWLNTPNIWIIDDNSMNAFATWFNIKNSWIVFSRWLLNKLNKQEIEAVAAHELTHIINKDSLLMLIVSLFIAWIIFYWETLLRIWISSWNSSSNKENNWWWQIKGLLFFTWMILIFSWYILLPLFRLAISRKREFLADAWSVELTKDKYSMISALQKISDDSNIESIKNNNFAYLFIDNPIKNKNNFWGNLFKTHPSIEDRINALKNY